MRALYSGVLLISSNCVRADLLRVCETLARTFPDRGANLISLLAPGLRRSDLDAKFLPELERWDEILEEKPIPRERLRILLKAGANAAYQLLRGKNPRDAFLQSVGVLRAKAFLEAKKVDFVLGVDYSGFTHLGVAAELLGLPTYGIQHGPYPIDRLPPEPQEWPAKNIFTWSSASTSTFQKFYSDTETTFIPGGPLWNLRHHSPPRVKRRMVMVVESFWSPLLGEVLSTLMRFAGRDNIVIKPHPYRLLLGESQAMKEYPELCDTTPFWDQVPGLAISLGSSSGQELIHLGVPVVTLLHKYDAAQESSSFGRFLCSPSGINDALRLVRKLLEQPEKQFDFLRSQQDEIRELREDADQALNRIVTYVLAQANR